MIRAQLAITFPGKRTRKQGVRKNTCSKCDGPLEFHRIGVHAYCLACHAFYMRLHRPRHSELPDSARIKANARSYALVYLKRGMIKREGCEVCGGHAQMHHDDYSKPTAVRWFCRKHHLELHKLYQ